MKTINELIKEQATMRPEAFCILAPASNPLTYHQLYQQIRKTLTTLTTFGIGRNDRVAVVLPNGPEMAVAALSIMGGATCAPLNPAYQAAEFEFYLRDLNAKALMLLENDASPAREIANSLGIQVLEIKPIPGQAGLFEIAGDKPELATSHIASEAQDVALVLHTSGTTSRPKIVPLSNANLCASADHIVHTLKLSEDDRCLNIMPLFHIHGLVAALLASLRAGGSVVCSPGYQQDKFFSWLNEYKPSWYTAVPTMHQSILAEYTSRTDDNEPSSLRFIRSSSSALPPSVMQSLETAFQAPVIEAYGMTEAAHQMASNPLPPGSRKPGSVGPAAGPEVAIMDDEGALVAQGGVGEIVIRGSNITPGYENNPEANAKAFSNSWFRTGDQGYLDEEGYLFITGRLKEIINRGGEKISPREVDEALMLHPAVGQAVAFAMPHESLGEDLAAAVVLAQGQTISEQELRDHAFGCLADFKVPSQIIFLDEIPKGATGKIQRIGLAEKLQAELESHYIPPANDIETLLVSIYAEVLGIDQIGVQDNFFALGGDSLKATQVVVRVNEFFQLELPVVILFHQPTVAGIAEEITAKADSQTLAFISELVNELHGMSDEEVNRQLEE